VRQSPVHDYRVVEWTNEALGGEETVSALCRFFCDESDPARLGAAHACEMADRLRLPLGPRRDLRLRQERPPSLTAGSGATTIADHTAPSATKAHRPPQ
jgi:hypothetical protein